MDTLSEDPKWLLLILMGIVALLWVLGLLVSAKLVRTVKQGQALLVTGPSGSTRVYFGGAVVYPLIRRADVMDIRLQVVPIERRDSEALFFRDGRRGEARFVFYIRISPTAEDIDRVARSVGCERASDLTTLRELFTARLTEAMKETAKELDFEEARRDRLDFVQRVFVRLGPDLDGYRLEDIAIDHLTEA